MGRAYLLLVALAWMFSSCGYRFADSDYLYGYRTLEVPFVQGDLDGRLTHALIRAVEASGNFSYAPCSATLVLQVCLVDRGTENIGFQYDQNFEGQRTKRIVANEGRLTIEAQVSLYDRSRNCQVLGPFCVCESIDYDFNPLATDTSVSIFSLGQFTSIDDAEEAACSPLYDRLARKIVDSLSAYW